ncbi:hypothetical protein SAMN05444272_1181 [Roseibium suaedae]|uniref:Uncharacterized protein n=1 Tax=Roseibium suaedae TaxID=735517 RepID=A0A1M7CJE8_9HYPH|nr:hypothetical protein SAMN05444272_1181 [Roseibium suaedae]
MFIDLTARLFPDGPGLMAKGALSLFVMVGLDPTICKPLTCLGPRLKAEDDGGEVAALSAVWARLISGGPFLFLPI